MVGKNWIMVLVGIILVLLAIAGVFSLVAETSGHVIHREKICIAPALQEGSLDEFWGRILATTGIDADTGALTALSLDINPDGSVKAIELQFTAKKNGTVRLYSTWYRKDSGECGWMDGLTYPYQQEGPFPPAGVNPRLVMDDVRDIPMPDLGLAGRNVHIVTDNSWDPVSFSRDDLSHEKLYLWTNHSLVPLRLIRMDARTFQPFSLVFYPRTCTVRQEGIVSCHDDRSLRVFPDSRLIGHPVQYMPL